MKRILFFCLGVVGMLAANAQHVVHEPNAQPNWSVLNDQDFSIQYPKDWQLDQSGTMGSNFFLYSTLEGEGDSFRENFNLMVNDLREYPGMTLKELAEGGRQQIMAMITDVKIKEFKEVTTKYDHYYLVEYTGKQGNFDLYWKQRYMLTESGYMYVLTFTAEEGQFARYSEKADQVFNTFQIK
ncbi:MAG: hypothetical protein H6576_05120 [Lewinellaceae bacterium]|nr:hypothetical protein [Saprospiraceae bacterium]MCB9343051.1 hypothetical protein [Lewinellaceae bacterium]